jgi:hypothetical protein
MNEVLSLDLVNKMVVSHTRHLPRLNANSPRPKLIPELTVAERLLGRSVLNRQLAPCHPKTVECHFCAIVRGKVEFVELHPSAAPSKHCELQAENFSILNTPLLRPAEGCT